MSAGKVKMAPAEMDVPADAPVATMLFSRILDFPNNAARHRNDGGGNRRGHGRPANNPTYAFADARMTVRTDGQQYRLDRELRCRRHCTPPINF